MKFVKIPDSVEDECHVCGQPSVVSFRGARTMCGVCGNEVVLCREHALQAHAELTAFLNLPQ